MPTDADTDAAGTDAARVDAAGADAATWPRAPDGRHRCTPARPMPADHRARFGPESRWQHEAAESIGETHDGAADRFRCRSCGVQWTCHYDD